MSSKYEIAIDRFDGGMSNDPRLQDSSLCDLVSNFDIFNQPKRLKPVRSMVADTNDGSTSTGMKQYGVKTFGVLNGVNNIYGLGTKSDGSGYKLFKKTSITGNWAAISNCEGTDTMVAGVLQPSVGSNQHLYFFGGDRLLALNYNSGSEYIHPPYDFTDITSSVCEGVIAKDQESYIGRNNSIVKLTAPGGVTTFNVTIASPAVFTCTDHGLTAGARVRFSTTGALPTGLTAGAEYYVMSAGLTANAFQVSTSISGAAVNTSGTQSGVHSVYRPPVAATQISVPATHEVSSLDNYGNYLAFSAMPRLLSTSRSTKFAGLAANATGVGDVAWTSGSEAATSDDVYASVIYGTTIDLLVVGGGGGANYSSSAGGPENNGGGGGAVTSASAISVALGAYSITVGGGGAGIKGGTAGSGGNSSAFGYSANGGQGGNTTKAGDSGNGNGGNSVTNSGGGGAGGAGSGGSSSTGGAGGAGVLSSITGASVEYGHGGGGGATNVNGDSGPANAWNYGRGGCSNGYNYPDGTTGTGGAVIIRYLTAAYGTCTGGTKTTDGAYTIHTFTSSGTFTLVGNASGVTNYIKATNFGFAIPVGATISGITAEIERKCIGTVTDNVVKIVKADGTYGGTNKAIATPWGTSDQYISYGHSSDIWNESWTPADINDADFGVAIGATLADGSTAYIDSIRITVDYYLDLASYPNLSSFLYIWDLVSEDVTETVDMGPGKLSVIANLGGVIVGITEEYISDTFGNDKGKIVIRAWSGGEAQILKEIPALASGGSLAKWKHVKGGRVYFYAKVPADTNASTYREGIWSFGRKDANSPWALSLEVDTSQFASSIQGFKFIGNFLMAAHSTDGSLSRSDDTETYTYTSIYQSQVFENDYENQLTSVELTTEPLPSGASAIVKIRQDEETNWTTLFTMNTANQTYDLRSRLPNSEDFAKFHSLQFRIESTGGAVPVRLRARYEKLSDQSDE